MTRIDFLEKQVRARKKKENTPALLVLLNSGVSKNQIGKMAESGITIEELKAEYSNQGKRGLEVCLGVQVNGKPRVKINKGLLGKIIKCLEAQ